MSTIDRSLRTLPPRGGWGPGDMLVLLGELFGRGYANGIVDVARRAGMTVVGATVGRRDDGGLLRPLTEVELGEAAARLGGRIVNVPLEAGFDLEPAGPGLPSPVEQMKAHRHDGWREVRLDWELIRRSQEAGARRFEAAAAQFAEELERFVPATANVLFVHTMAGGFPRGRIFMPLVNRIFRGTGEKYLPSGEFWGSELGRLWAASFEEVTGRTLERLVRATASLRARAGEARVRYVAYGYHGCEVLIDGQFTWQSYVPYLQGWAKLLLERVADEAWREGVQCTVFNAPEISTSSSALFLGVEISLYPLLEAVRRAGGNPSIADDLWRRCAALLKPGATVEGMLARAAAYLSSPALAGMRDPAGWPQPSTAEQMEVMLAASAELFAMSADVRSPIVAELSRSVFDAVGQLMFDSSWQPPGPVQWLNHDVVAERISRGG